MKFKKKEELTSPKKTWAAQFYLTLCSGTKVEFKIDGFDTEEEAVNCITSHKAQLLKAKKAKIFYEFDFNCSVEASQVAYFMAEVVLHNTNKSACTS